MANFSSSWLMAQLAKGHHQRAALDGNRGSDGPESAIHREILEECRRRGWIALHGSMAHRAMRTPGEWDFTILGDGGRVWFLEAKVRTGKLSTDQQAIHAWAHKLGHTVHVVRSTSDAIRILSGGETKEEV